MKICFFEHALAMVLAAVVFTVLTNALPWLVIAIVLTGQYLMTRQRMKKETAAIAAEADKDIQLIKGEEPTPVERISARWEQMEFKQPEEPKQ